MYETIIFYLIGIGLRTYILIETVISVTLKALVNIVVDRLKKKVRAVLADLYNYVQVDE